MTVWVWSGKHGLSHMALSGVHAWRAPCRNAKSVGADLLELDVQMTRDGIIVVVGRHPDLQPDLDVRAAARMAVQA